MRLWIPIVLAGLTTVSVSSCAQCKLGQFQKKLNEAFSKAAGVREASSVEEARSLARVAATALAELYAISLIQTDFRCERLSHLVEVKDCTPEKALFETAAEFFYQCWNGSEPRAWETYRAWAKAQITEKTVRENSASLKLDNSLTLELIYENGRWRTTTDLLALVAKKSEGLMLRGILPYDRK